MSSAGNLSKQFGTEIKPNKMFDLIWMRTVWRSDGIPESFFFQKSRFQKKSTDDKKSMKNYPAGKEFEIPLGGAVWKGETMQMSSFVNNQLRIEMQFLACTGWCKTLGFLMSVKPEGLLGDIKKLIICIIQYKLKIWISILIFTFYIINQTYLIIFHPNSQVILEKWNILFTLSQIFGLGPSSGY